MNTELLTEHIELKQCPACGSKEIESFRTIKEFPAILFPIEKDKCDTVRVVSIKSSTCNDCGHVFLDDLDKSLSDLIYQDYYYLYPFKGLESMQGIYREAFEKVASLYFSSKLSPSLLEIGCESVEQMKFFLDLNFTCTAINPGAKPDNNVEFINGFYGKDTIDNQFNYIVSRFSLEHIINCDMFFSELRKNISTDGIVIVQVPNIEYFLSIGVLNILAHEHPHYFCQKSLLAMIRRYGFEILHISKTDEPSLICAFTLQNIGVSFKPKQALDNASSVIRQIKELIRSTSSDVILYGAGLSLTALLYDGSFDEQLKNKVQIVDDNPVLSGRYMPNTTLEVIPSEEMKINADSTIILMLSEHYQQAILTRLLEKHKDNVIYGVDKGGLTCLNEKK